MAVVWREEAAIAVGVSRPATAMIADNDVLTGVNLRRMQASIMNYQGSCHCRNLRIEFATETRAAEIEVRAYQCSFCRKHGSHAVADSAGQLLIRAERGDLVGRHAFGLRTAEYLICRNCGVYVAAVTTGESQLRGIAIVNCLDERRQFAREPIVVDYSSESRDGRIERRRRRWTPAILVE
jgi:hypothetical protein